MEDQLIKVQDVTLASLDAEEVFEQYLQEVQQNLFLQDAGKVVDGKVDLTLKISFERANDGVRYTIEGKVKAPGYKPQVRTGHMTPDGRIRVLGQPRQMTLQDYGKDKAEQAN